MERKEEEENEDDIVCLDESFFMNNEYLILTHLPDFDLTGQLVWPGAILMNNYISKNTDMLQGCSIIELGSGVATQILKKNVELHATSECRSNCSGLAAEKLEWGDSNHMRQISEQYPGGFDLHSISPLFDTVNQLFRLREVNCCKFILAYVSRAKSMDTMVMNEAVKHGMQVSEVQGTRGL
ncbi:hypothetical protein IFM89_028387 [Coptis chinensis]|uniref:Uncharacterized protein n=1 Tax=Coptis chinensis TaxID=261450 RepID=A0A835HC14_9MAGN|nr:hypothetical protein IFM89_028387 [Coptis chinensis]